MGRVPPQFWNSAAAGSVASQQLSLTGGPSAKQAEAGGVRCDMAAVAASIARHKTAAQLGMDAVNRFC